MFAASSPRQPMATWNPARGVWETATVNLFCGHSELYSETWPASGSMRSGSVFRRPEWVPPTSGSGCSSSPGLPTPRARDWKSGGYEDGLEPVVAKLLPTPTTSEGTGVGHAAQGGMNLRTTVSLLPTPTAADSRNTARLRLDGTPYGVGTQKTLVDATRLLPTPRASAGAKGGPNQRGSSGDLTLPSAAHRIGASTAPPSPAGSTSQDSQLPGQLTIEDALLPPSSSG